MQIIKITDATSIQTGDLSESDVWFGLLEHLDTNNLVEAQLRDRIYWKLPAGDSNNQRTCKNRFDHINFTLKRLVKQHLEDRTVLRVLDAGCSDAITSCEWFGTFPENTKIEMLACDLHTKFEVITSQIGEAIYRDDGICIQFKLRNRFWTAPFLKRTIKNKAKSMLLSLAGWTMSNMPLLQLTKSTVSLFHPEALSLSNEKNGFRLVQKNITKPINQEFDLIRIMNVFHNWHLNDVMQTVRTVSSSLTDGGVICIGYGQSVGTWSAEYGERISFFRRSADRLVSIEDLNAPIKEKQAIENLQLISHQRL
ncbi:class I SAM-dependent methyltransferase [Amylibacter sp.]|jgi:hypothetical protein|nr:class I SAM-dependent methyltransferase [Amylibacter sp.]